jgi:hypothetical protein
MVGELGKLFEAIDKSDRNKETKEANEHIDPCVCEMYVN